MNLVAPVGRATVPPGYYVSAALMDGGFFLIMAAMPFRVLDLGGGGLALGLTAAIGALAYIVAAPLAGRLSDRLPRRRLAALGAGALVICALAAWLTRSLPVLLVLQAFMGLGKALYWPPVQATLGDLTTPATRPDVLGRFNVAWSGGKMLGFLLGGVLLARVGFEAAYLVGAGSVVLAAVSLPRTAGRDTDVVADDDRSEAVAANPAGFLPMAWVANTTAYAAFGILTYHLPQYLEGRGWQADRYGWFLGAILASQTVVFLWLGFGRRHPWSTWRLLVPQLLAMVALALLPTWNSLAPLLLTAPLVGWGCGVCYQASLSASLDDPGVRGRRAGVHEGLIGAGGFAPPLLAGFLVSQGLGLASPYLLAAVLLGAAVVLQLLLQRRAATIS